MFVGGYFSTTYRSEFDIESYVPGDQAELEGLVGNNFSGITRTEASSQSYSGGSEDTEYEYCQYNW